MNIQLDIMSHDALLSCILLMNCAMKRPDTANTMLNECEFVTHMPDTPFGWGCRDRLGRTRALDVKEVSSFLTVTQSKKKLGDSLSYSSGLQKEEIEWVIRSNLGEVRACYDNSKLFGSKPGRIKASFSIQFDGLVSKLEVTEDSIGSRMLTQCVTEALQNWKFPTPRGGESIAVAYPFVFTI